MMQRLPYHRVPVIRPFFDDFVHFFHNKVQKNRHGLIKFNSHDHTASPDLADPVPEPGSLKVQTRKEMDKVNKR